MFKALKRRAERKKPVRLTPDALFLSGIHAGVSRARLDDDANWLLGLSGSYLFVDSGTGPDPRGLKIYDLGKAQVMFKTSYFNLPELKNGRYLSYDKYVQEMRNPLTDPDRELCSQAGQWLGVGLRVGLYKPFRLDLISGQEAAIGTATCISMQ